MDKTVILGKIKSAYEAALLGGYTGTREEFYALLGGLSTELGSKVPVGFGWAESVPNESFLENPDGITKTGLYKVLAKSLLPDLTYGGNSLLFHQAFSDDYAVQILYFLSETSGVEFAGVCAKRTKENGIWGETEYINPPKIVDTEYRTVERIKGKAVYKKLDASGTTCWRVDGETAWKRESKYVGAAPDGYGLGSQYGKMIYENTEGGLNAAVENGWYIFGGGGNIANRPENFINSGYGLLLVSSRGENDTVVQIAFSETTGAIAIRFRLIDTWQPWEYLNPMLLANVEYRTTERFYGHPVFCKMVSLGQLPSAGSKVVQYQESGVVQYVVRFDATSEALGSLANSDRYKASVDKKNITVQLIGAAAEAYGDCVVYYTKYSDQ